ncbi:MAG: fumarylacetoacetate hydrolase family protein [Bacteroidales bacterium]
MKIICIGKNYRDHAKEMNSTPEKDPVFFLKADSCLQKDSRPFFVPDFSKEIHHEIEIVLRIGKVGRSIAEKFASRYYDAFTLGIDFTARDLQRNAKAKGLPWEISKSFDQSARIGKWLDPEPLKNKDNIPFWLKKNQNTVQEGNSSDMIFSPEQIIAYVSQFMTLKTGDLIFTGTPKGVGPVEPGDTITAGTGKNQILRFPVK